MALSLDTMTHVHVESNSRDCDGAYERESVWTPTGADSFRDLWTYAALSNLGRDWEFDATFTRGTTEDGAPFVEYWARTDEGYRRERIEGCADDCDRDARRYRDHTAEAAGY